ncbi:MAG TPA: hypothetical protein PKD11_06870 [Pyrinomonadaceae bacterium]|nr:hypothetical protein [Pyrinomonadaceae bacterium]
MLGRIGSACVRNRLLPGFVRWLRGRGPRVLSDDDGDAAINAEPRAARRLVVSVLALLRL